jgi:hypothetical protein
MQAWAGVVLSCAALLVIAGVPKLANPTSTIVALRSVGVSWVGRRAARLLAAAEIGAGIAAIVAGGRLADSLVALLYLGFSLFLVKALGTPAASCGCTARDDTPPTVAHLVMTVVFCVGSAAAVLVGGRTGVLSLARDAAAPQFVVALGIAGLTGWLAWSVLTLSLRSPSPRRT